MKRIFMTQKERVIERYPSAFSYSMGGTTTIYARMRYSGPSVKLGTGCGTTDAWRAAADALVMWERAK